ncbi:MAG: 4-hydroxy-tetrahydrodipicolinate synthase [Peptococcaceae bacterium]|jgi:4-hydroxy-tetrahydrodipicolinate synthase|nr:4-hydroxy-tetrahydrodipicolinate synthase [Peptococcaceae bacterium]
MFGKVLTAMVTPFDESLNVNYGEAVKIARFLAENGSDGIVVAGTTGEAPNLSAEEKIKLFKEIKQAVGDSLKVIAGVGTYSTAESVRVIKRCSDLGLDGIMAVVPYYNKPSQEGLYQHFKTIAEATDLPVMLYNIPGRTSINMLPQTVKRLAEIPNIVCIKEAAGNMDQVSELKTSLPAGFTVYAGDDSLTLPMLSLGGAGVVSVASHLVGKQIKKMVEAFFKGEYQTALKWHSLLYPIFKGLFITSNPVPVKFLLNEIGFKTGTYRLPLVGPTQSEQLFLKELLAEIRRLPEEI